MRALVALLALLRGLVYFNFLQISGSCYRTLCPVQDTDAWFVKVMLLFTKLNSKSGEMFLGPTVCGVVSFLFGDTDPPYIIAIWLAFHGRRLFVSPR